MKKFGFEDLKNKVCVVTGGGGILGTSMAEALVSAGIKTIILDLNPEAAKTLAGRLSKEYDVETMGIAVNVLDKSSLNEAKDTIIEKFGRIDFLINAAGGNSPRATTKVEQIIPDSNNDFSESFFGLEMEGFKQVFDLNFMGTLLPTMVFAESMVSRGKGVIINISSMNAFKPLTKIPAYSAAKASINNFTQWLAVHFGKTGVRVNGIAPGFFLTNQNRFLLTDEKTAELTARGEKIIANTPVGKFGNPEDIQGSLLFLLSDMSSFVNGVILPVDGGYSAFGGV
ncbi:MAG: SDR family oxidoreductase [Bacteroidales bacterium]|jgi:NAD(P)-dependent dehydrogenase (short-subunit alcohol dehydrogenase family)